MEINKLHLAYFSATKTTQSIVRQIAAGIDIASGMQLSSNFEEHNITKVTELVDIEISCDELLIIGMPSYYGRVPEVALKAIDQFKGNNSPVVIACAFGNRDYEDTLLELRDLMTQNGFVPISAAAFVARHSIFPEVANDRPNSQDLEEAKRFGKESYSYLQDMNNLVDLGLIEVKGKYPYKDTGNIPFAPEGDKKCDSCGTCVSLCPVDAIPADAPRTTNVDKCIACARCIAVCPQKARKFSGVAYSLTNSKFKSANSSPKQNEAFWVAQV